ncbi:type III secretion system translocon subunit SctB [Achromobacter xylosoxidans]|uniref:type III secretion system translocon subunit SctB n=1 Tax=Alcaligenes xylosoxydans xylosoxydans TaxID=85698 RepID=UPI001F13BAD4|nr:type III secretion system translocon subunit SctB [Achromobacter xylosoxidans]
MNINSAGGAGANLPQNLDDLAASPDVIKSVLENARMIASENEAIKQKLLGAMGATGPVDPKDLALISAEIGQKLQDALGGLRGLPAPDVTQGAGPVFDAMSRLSEQEVQTDIYAFMALFQQLAQTMRSSAREVRANELQAQVDTLKGAAQEMRDAAKDRMIGAMTQGAFQIFGGLAQAGSGGLQLGVLAKGGAGAEARAQPVRRWWWRVRGRGRHRHHDQRLPGAEGGGTRGSPLRTRGPVESARVRHAAGQRDGAADDGCDPRRARQAGGDRTIAHGNEPRHRPQYLIP